MIRLDLATFTALLLPPLRLRLLPLAITHARTTRSVTSPQPTMIPPVLRTSSNNAVLLQAESTILSNPGPIQGGHRSINWDAAAVPFGMPFEFFNTVTTRDAIFKAKGKKFAVSNPATPPPEDDLFSSFLPKGVKQQFKRFSLERLYTPVFKNKGLNFAGIVVVDPHNPHKLIPAIAKSVMRLGSISVDDFRPTHLNRHGANGVVVVEDLVYGETVAQH